MNEPLDEAYLSWLYQEVADVRLRSPKRTFWALLRQLYKTEFVWLIANDDNRVVDGRELRYEFLDQHQIEDVSPDWLELKCSVLEMLIGLSRRLSFEAEGEPRGWFWHLLNNLGLDSSNDADSLDPVEIDEIVGALIWRRYSRDGAGGLFPLRKTTRDQRKVEIWYQMCDYLLQSG